jgi:hypothetical protein
MRMAFETPSVKERLILPALNTWARETLSDLALLKTKGNCKVRGQFSCQTSCQKLMVSPDPIILVDPICKKCLIEIIPFQNGEQLVGAKELYFTIIKSFQ